MLHSRDPLHRKPAQRPDAPITRLDQGPPPLTATERQYLAVDPALDEDEQAQVALGQISGDAVRVLIARRRASRSDGAGRRFADHAIYERELERLRAAALEFNHTHETWGDDSTW